MRVNIYANPLNYDIAIVDLRDITLHIGLEDGAYFAYQKGIPLSLAMGDFDTIKPAHLKELEQAQIPMLHYPEKKDQSDTALAITYALAQGATSIKVYGGIGGRFDHSYTNFISCKMAPVTYISNNTKMYALQPGIHTLKVEHPIISFFALEPVKKLTLEGFAYQVHDYDLNQDDPLCLSNEGEGTVHFQRGILGVIESSEG